MVSITLDKMRRLAPRGRSDILAAVAAGDEVLARYDITTPSRLCHFMAQIAHESAGFQTTEEPASGAAYEEGRKDLGNVRRGDGVRFKGRGLIQLTGRANYRVYGERLGVDLEANPARAAVPDFSLLVACEYWKDKGLNALADRDDVTAITRRINGGTNGLADRKAKLKAARAIWGGAQITDQTSGSEEVTALQRDLLALGHDIAVDGLLGPKTRAAVRAVQSAAGIKVDGIAGPATRDAIQRLLAARPATGKLSLPGVVEALRTKEGLSIAAATAGAVLNAAANPGPLAWAVAFAIVAAVLVGGYYFIRRLRREAVL